MDNDVSFMVNTTEIFRRGCPRQRTEASLNTQKQFSETDIFEPDLWPLDALSRPRYIPSAASSGGWPPSRY
jgi:hypothetical protein